MNKNMRIRFLIHGFNRLGQRLLVALRARGHQVFVKFNDSTSLDSLSLEAVTLLRPDLIVGPFLMRAIRARFPLKSGSTLCAWCCILAIDDLVQEIICCAGHLTLSVLRGNAGAGGAFLALVRALVWLHDNRALNAHYKNMGNLHGSEYSTYLLPQRADAKKWAFALRTIPAHAAT
ncbi:MAG: hypothetical protein ACI83P_001928 [Janthinobacterium sp.]|jgi:hypothetical protein